ncbi:MAG: dihydrodiol dehydrogenase / D-xylose 1-dehydrogenase (NADP) [Reinekea sp.]|jgi:dihydrodiol dehydrogenase / D-xylose 1-dehydrogenase (NADP)|uniref:Gfo/Idh/MocA family protein n=1 Tax=Reinekea sp. TaxID=1970455 RepID=UPI003989B9D5
MNTTKWGILGPGRIAMNFANAMNVVENSQIKGVFSSNLERGQRFADDFNIPQVYASKQALLSDSEIDVIYIAYPHNFHYDAVKECLLAGKAVLCEKPLTVTAEQAQELFDLAQTQHVFLMEAMWSRFLPVWQQVKQWIASGQLGDIQFINSTFGFKVPREESDRLLNPELAGGVLLDMGVYNISLSQYVMACDPDSIRFDVLRGQTGVDERTSVWLRYGDVLSQFSCSFTANYDNEFIIHGTKANIRVPAMFWGATKVILTPNEGEAISFNQPFDCNGFEYQIREVNLRIAQGEIQSSVMPWRDTLSAARVMDKVLGI